MMMSYMLPLIERTDVAEGTMAFWFSTKGTDFSFEAGQNADFEISNLPNPDAKGNLRTFSIASSPHHTDRIMIATRMRASAFKHHLKTMPLGATILVHPPGGNMVLHDDATKPAVFLAGGIGITPMRSIIEWATHERKPHELWLISSNRTRQAAAFLDDFAAWEKVNPRLRVVHTITDDTVEEGGHGEKFRTGRIDETLLRSILPNVTKPVYYLAGPPAMVDAMKTTLLAASVARGNIRFESFSGY